MDEINDDFVDNYMQWLIDEGALYVGDYDKYGEAILYMNPPLLKELCEPLYNHFLMEVDSAVLSLVDKGYATMEWDELQGDFVTKLTELGREVMSGDN